MPECGVCFDECEKGVKCASTVKSHWTCGDCLVRHATALAEDATRFSATSEAAGKLGIPCPGHHDDLAAARRGATKPCDSGLLSWKSVLEQVDNRACLSELFEAMHKLSQAAEVVRQDLLKSRRALMDEVTASAAAAVQSSSSSQASSSSSSQASLVAILCDQVKDRALALRCPNCDVLVAQDWDKCAAVRCDSANGGCSHYFCAICFYQSGRDVKKGVPDNDHDIHRHVALEHGSQVPEDITPIIFNGRMYYTSAQTHKDAHERIRCQRIVALLAPHSHAVRDQVLQQVQPQLKAVEIDSKKLTKYFADHFSETVAKSLQTEEESKRKEETEKVTDEDLAAIDAALLENAVMEEDPIRMPAAAVTVTKPTPFETVLRNLMEPIQLLPKKEKKEKKKRKAPAAHEDDEPDAPKQRKVRKVRNQDSEPDDDAEPVAKKRSVKVVKTKKQKITAVQPTDELPPPITPQPQWLPESGLVLMAALPAADQTQIWLTLQALHNWLTYEAGARAMLLNGEAAKYTFDELREMTHVQAADASLRKWWETHVPDSSSWMRMRNQRDSQTYLAIVEIFLRKLFNSRPRGRDVGMGLWADDGVRGNMSLDLRKKAASELVTLSLIPDLPA